VEKRANEVRQQKGIDVRILSHTSHEAVLQLLGSARISIGISASDGAPAAMLESMILGAYPIQSETSGATDWIEDGRNGSVVFHNDRAQITTAIRRALLDDELVNEAARINSSIAKERLDGKKLKQEVRSIYERIVQEKLRFTLSDVDITEAQWKF
jgi:glycosyltransferase involved in cell wall biosynthesis